MRTASSGAGIKLQDRVWEAVALARMHIAKRMRPINFVDFDRFVTEYDEQARVHLGRGLSTLKIVEIGFGARPLRISWLYSMGCDVRGIDLEVPLLRLELSGLLELYKKNGLQRALKSALRQLITGQKEWNDLARYFNQQHPNRRFEIPLDRLIVADAGDEAAWSSFGQVDVIYSEDVFEHIPLDVIPRVLTQMSRALNSDGIALIRPHVFTGIAEGHNVEWYFHTLKLDMARRSEPWEHLRKDRYPANTYLNRARLGAYLDLISAQFEILDVIKPATLHGVEFLTPEIEAELCGYSREELLTNQVLFVAKKRYDE